MARYKTFLISFAVCLVIFSVIAAILMSTLAGDKSKTNTNPKEKDQKQSEKSNDKEPLPDAKQVSNLTELKGKTFAMVVGKTDSDTGALTSLTLFKADKENERFVLSQIPTTVELAITGEDKDGQPYSSLLNFNELYPIFGPEYIMKKVYALTGVKVDYYLFFDDAGMKQFADDMGGVTIDLPYDVLSYTPEDTEKQTPSVEIPAGSQTLKGDKAVQFFNYTDNPNGETERMELGLKFAQTCLSKLFGTGNKTTASKAVGKIIRQTQTNYTQDDFNANADLILKYGTFENKAVKFPATLSAIDSQSGYSAVFDAYKEYK